ncbi:MAG TPA: hypothetical protein VGH42_04295 [Verrucomicrobiae bacterium]|jgi:hypothetical protein
MNGDDVTNKTEFIPDFYREFISRIIPGLVVIALYIYWSETDFKVVFSSYLMSSFLLIAAWIIGVTLDVGIFLIVDLIVGADKFIPKPQKNPGESEPTKHQEKSLESNDNAYTDEWEYLCKAKPWERGIILKTLSQVIFFCVMFSICALAVILSLASISERFPKLNCGLPVLFQYKYYYLVSALVFSFVYLLCWWKNRKHFFEHIEKLLKRQKGQQKEQARCTYGSQS